MWLRRIGMMAVIAMTWSGLPAYGQSCDTMEPCMTNGMCMPDGTCQGTPVNGGSCEVPQADATCTAPSGTCVNGMCKGDPAPVGTSCAAGCGTCQLASPNGTSTICMTTSGQGGKPCDPGLGPCFPGTCGSGQYALCQITYKTCPDIDNNPCTADICNPSTGQCEHLDTPPCDPTCETCNPTTGQCEPANQGAACAGVTACTAQGHCGSISTGIGLRGACLPGAATAPSATIPATGGPTPTSTPAPPGLCAGDCSGDDIVTVNELITLVNITLGSAQAAACPDGIPSGAAVNVALIIQAVNDALNGCAIAAPTPTPVTHTVVVGPNGMLTFSPQALTIHVGDTVEWTWASGSHSVVSGGNCVADGQFCSPNDSNCAQTPLSSQGATYSHTFTAAGTYPYFCSVHCAFGMVGMITVQ